MSMQKEANAALPPPQRILHAKGATRVLFTIVITMITIMITVNSNRT
jgi:hypothetical protein